LAAIPIKFEKLDYKIDLVKRTHAARVGNSKVEASETFVHIPNTRKDKPKCASFRKRKKLKAKGKYNICKRSRYMANECLRQRQYP